jgi:hypothetical protein
MTAAAAETPAPPIQTPSTDAVFLSRREQLRLCLKSRYPKFNPVTGQRHGWVEQGVYAAFAGGVFRVPAADKDGKVTLRDSLDGGSAKIDREWLLETMREHHLNGDKQEGFWEYVEKDAPPPTSDIEVATVIEAVRRGDADTLDRIVEIEKAGYNRKLIVEQAQAAAKEIRRSGAK